MGRSSKKGRVSGSQRKEINSKRAFDAVSGKSDGIIFGRVMKMLGFAQVIVGIESRTGVKEIHARIPNILGRRGATPITARDVVAVFVGTEFDSSVVIRPSDKFDITAVLTHKMAYGLMKEGVIPSWMIADGEADKTAGGVDATGFEFDYSGVKEEGGEDSDAEDAADAKMARAAADFTGGGGAGDEVDIDDI